MIMVEGTIGDCARSFFALSHRSGIDSNIFGSSLGDTTICLFFSILLIFMACTHAPCKSSSLFNEYETRIAQFRPSSPVITNDMGYMNLNHISSNQEGTRPDTITP